MKKTVIKAKDVMHQQYLALNGLTTVKEALAAMRATQSDVVMVNKRDENDAWGVVLLSDIVKKVLAKDKAPERVNVYEIMSKPVIPIDPELDVRYVARLFARLGISNAPVIEDHKIIGIVSYDDLVFKGLCELID